MRCETEERHGYGASFGRIHLEFEEKETEVAELQLSGAAGLLCSSKCREGSFFPLLFLGQLVLTSCSSTSGWRVSRERGLRALGAFQPDPG